MPNQELKNEEEPEDEEVNDLPTELYEELVKPEVTLPEIKKPKLSKDEIYEGKVTGRTPKGFLRVDYKGFHVILINPKGYGFFTTPYVPSKNDYKIGTIVGFRITSELNRRPLWGEVLYKKKQK